jgi:protein involved in polysaccharide export with SLBB domain
MRSIKIIFFSLFVLCALSVVLLQPVQAQNISSMNFSTVNVDNLSDAQIRQFMLQAQKSGMSDDQIAQLALSKGMSPLQLQKLKARIARLSAADSARLQSVTGITDTTQGSFTGGLKTPGVSDTLLHMEDALNALRPKIFGEELFNNPNMTFEPNLNIPTPPNYQLGPNDELVINIYGYSQADYHLTVSNEGSVNIPYIGLVYVNGLTMDQAAARIKAKLSTVYSAIKTGKTSVQVSLGRIRSIRVTIMGEVTKPGTYTLPSLATLFNALYASGGPDQNGSFRDIEVIRNSKVIDTMDVYDFLMNGNQSHNIRLQDQDIIRIPVYKDRVQIMGQVKRPGIYEMLPDESLQNLITYAGGFSDSAYTASIKAVRLTSTEKEVSDIHSADFAAFQPQNGDKYSVGSILDKYKNRVIIDGAVYRPGQYALTDGLTLSQLIKDASGLREDAFLPRGYIIRQNPDLTTSSIQFDVAKIMDGQATDIPLQKEDVVHVYSIFDLRDQYAVTIEGAVRTPGSYKYADSMTLEDLIMQAGGFAQGASAMRVEVSRRMINSNPHSRSAEIAKVFQVNINKDLSMNAQKFVLHPFDVVAVRMSPGYELQKQVRVEGEVLYPGLYTITARNERISDLIKRAGGLTDFAYPQGASLTRVPPYDTSKRIRQFERLQHSVTADSTGQYASMIQQGMQNDNVGIYLDKILKNPDSKYDLFVQDGDVLNIPRQLQTVQVNGEVLYPVTTPYDAGRGIKYYISQAGGFNTRAKRRRVYVVYANGYVRSTGGFLFLRHYPKVEPGSQIFVPVKPEGRKMSAAEVLGLTTGAASLTAVILTIISLVKK